MKAIGQKLILAPIVVGFMSIILAPSVVRPWGVAPNSTVPYPKWQKGTSGGYYLPCPKKPGDPIPDILTLTIVYKVNELKKSEANKKIQAYLRTTVGGKIIQGKKEKSLPEVPNSDAEYTHTLMVWCDLDEDEKCTVRLEGKDTGSNSVLIHGFAGVLRQWITGKALEKGKKHPIYQVTGRVLKDKRTERSEVDNRPIQLVCSQDVNQVTPQGGREYLRIIPRDGYPQGTVTLPVQISRHLASNLNTVSACSLSINFPEYLTPISVEPDSSVDSLFDSFEVLISGDTVSLFGSTGHSVTVDTLISAIQMAEILAIVESDVPLLETQPIVFDSASSGFYDYLGFPIDSIGWFDGEVFAAPEDTIPPIIDPLKVTFGESLVVGDPGAVWENNDTIPGWVGIGVEELYLDSLGNHLWLGVDWTPIDSLGGFTLIQPMYIDSFFVLRIVAEDFWGNADTLIYPDGYMAPEFAVISNPMFYLSESNVGNLGNQNDTAGMYLYGDANEPNFLFDGSPILGFISTDDDTVVGRYVYDEHYLMPETYLTVDTNANLKTIVAQAQFYVITPQLPLSWYYYWWWWTIEMKDYIFYSQAPDNNSEQYLSLKVLRLFHEGPPPWWPEITPPDSVPQTYLGMLLDINAPSDSGYWNYPFIDSTRRMAYLQGYGGVNENYLMGIAQRDTCYEYAAGQFMCWPNPWTLPQPDQPYAMLLLGNDNGFEEGDIYIYMSTPGYSIYGDGSPEDYTIVATGGEYETDILEPIYHFSVAYALVVSDDGVGKLNNCVDMIMCGNVNRDGMITVGDVVYYVNYLFRAGPEIWTYMGDANADGQATVSDVVYLINYLFRSGPPPQCSSL